MKLLTAVLVLLIASCNVLGDSSSSTSTNAAETTQPASGTTEGSSDTTVAGGSTASAGTGSTAAPGSTVTGGSNTGSTAAAATTTPTPIKLSTFPVSIGDTPLDAKLILQQAVQLDQQINALNDYLVKAQADTNPSNSPLFAQLNALSANITAQNATLQGYISQLQSLSTTQANIDSRLTSATNTFVCFSQSSCVTDVPTTPEPTSPGPTPPVATCTNQTLTTDTDYSKSKSTSVAKSQNAAPCVIRVLASSANNNVTVTINATLTGPDAYVRLVESRTQQSVSTNSSFNNYSFNGFQEVDVFYYSGPRSTVQFNFDYIEVNNCLLDCHYPNGTCKVSPSGVQYCECKKCEFSGDNCETPIDDPCQSKQKRLCGENADPKYGLCYRNSCFDQCYACSCSPGAESDSEQKCNSITNPSPLVAPTGSPVCPSTAAPTTTPALLTSTMAPSGSSTANPSAPTGASSASPAPPQTTVPSSTVTGGGSTNNSPDSTSSAVATSTNAPTTTS